MVSDPDRIRRMVHDALASEPVVDLHTHLYPPTFGTTSGPGSDPRGLMLWGIDELLTYHYLAAEFFRVAPQVSPEAYWTLNKSEQAELIWRTLFVERLPISEACRGLVTVLSKLGIDPSDRDLGRIRRFFAERSPEDQIDRVVELANVRSITMTNAVFDDHERERWLAGVPSDSRFSAALRIDPLVLDAGNAFARLNSWGFTGDRISAGRRFLSEWIDRVRAIYIAISLPPTFRWPGENDLLETVVLPVCREQNLPLAMMIGVTRGLNPRLRDAGDTSAAADMNSIANLCREFGDNRFLVTMLARENQHELCVIARKFANLLPFGCWWFLNTPSLIEEITRMRVELLGQSFIPQHSDSRILEQLIYKWEHTRSVLGKILSDKLIDLAATGWNVQELDVRRTVRDWLSGNFEAFLRGPKSTASTPAAR